jgi:hypothetical protein
MHDRGSMTGDDQDVMRRHDDSKKVGTSPRQLENAKLSRACVGQASLSQRGQAARMCTARTASSPRKTWS